jgi:hypothetical protein
VEKRSWKVLKPGGVFASLVAQQLSPPQNAALGSRGVPVPQFPGPKEAIVHAATIAQDLGRNDELKLVLDRTHESGCSLAGYLEPCSHLNRLVPAAVITPIMIRPVAR